MNAGEKTVTAVVLAGGEAGDAMAKDLAVEAKALLPIGPWPMGAYVLAALRAAPEVTDIVYVGPVDVRFAGMYDVAVPSGERITDSFALGLGAAMGRARNDRFLVVTADIPFIDGGVISRFLQAAPEGADLVYAVVREEAARARFPFQQRTYVRLRGGRLTGGNVVLLSPAVVPKLLSVLDKVFRARKNPVSLAAMLGIDVLLGLLFGRANLPMLEHRASTILGADARALVSDDAELAADVDRPAHMPGGLTDRLPTLSEPGVPGGASGMAEGGSS